MPFGKKRLAATSRGAERPRDGARGSSARQGDLHVALSNGARRDRRLRRARLFELVRCSSVTFGGGLSPLRAGRLVALPIVRTGKRRFGRLFATFDDQRSHSLA